MIPTRVEGFGRHVRNTLKSKMNHCFILSSLAFTGLMMIPATSGNEQTASICHSEDILRTVSLTCAQGTTLRVVDAYFHVDRCVTWSRRSCCKTNSFCHLSARKTVPEYWNDIVTGCSGQDRCRVRTRYIQTKCHKYWRPSNHLIIKYLCVKDRDVIKLCSQRVDILQISKALIQSPDYPLMQHSSTASQCTCVIKSVNSTVTKLTRIEAQIEGTSGRGGTNRRHGHTSQICQNAMIVSSPSASTGDLCPINISSDPTQTIGGDTLVVSVNHIKGGNRLAWRSLLKFEGSGPISINCWADGGFEVTTPTVSTDHTTVTSTPSQVQTETWSNNARTGQHRLQAAPNTFLAPTDYTSIIPSQETERETVQITSTKQPSTTDGSPSPEGTTNINQEQNSQTPNIPSTAKFSAKTILLSTFTKELKGSLKTTPTISKQEVARVHGSSNTQNKATLPAKHHPTTKSLKHEFHSNAIQTTQKADVSRETRTHTAIRAGSVVAINGTRPTDSKTQDKKIDNGLIIGISLGLVQLLLIMIVVAMGYRICRRRRSRYIQPVVPTHVNNWQQRLPHIQNYTTSPALPNNYKHRGNQLAAAASPPCMDQYCKNSYNSNINLHGACEDYMIATLRVNHNSIPADLKHDSQDGNIYNIPEVDDDEDHDSLYMELDECKDVAKKQESPPSDSNESVNIDNDTIEETENKEDPGYMLLKECSDKVGEYKKTIPRTLTPPRLCVSPPHSLPPSPTCCQSPRKGLPSNTVTLATTPSATPHIPKRSVTEPLPEIPTQAHVKAEALRLPAVGIHNTKSAPVLSIPEPTETCHYEPIPRKRQLAPPLPPLKDSRLNGLNSNTCPYQNLPRTAPSSPITGPQNQQRNFLTLPRQGHNRVPQVSDVSFTIGGTMPRRSKQLECKGLSRIVTDPSLLQKLKETLDPQQSDYGNIPSTKDELVEYDRLADELYMLSKLLRSKSMEHSQIQDICSEDSDTDAEYERMDQIRRQSEGNHDFNLC